MDGTTGQPGYAELAALVAQLQFELVALRAENQRLKQRIAELEKKNPTQRLQESYSVKADEKRRQDAEEKKSGKVKGHGSSGDRQASERRGRVPNHVNIDKADHHELVLPDGFDLPQCHPGIERPVWRIRDGKATLVVYEIWRAPNGKERQIDGVLPLSEFGFEIHVTVAFMVSMVGLSMDKVCTLLRFFWELELSKSQADALLNQLSRQWEHEFESLCQLLAAATTVLRQSRAMKRIANSIILSTRSRDCHATKSNSRLCFIRRLMRQTMKPNAAFAVRLRTAEPVAQAKLFEVLSGEQF